MQVLILSTSLKNMKQWLKSKNTCKQNRSRIILKTKTGYSHELLTSETTWTHEITFSQQAKNYL